MDHNDYTQRYIELILDGEEEYTFTHLTANGQWVEYQDGEIETFNVFDQWMEEQAEELIKDHIPRLNKLYEKYFASIINAIPLFSDIERHLVYGVKAYKVNAPIGFREKFNTYINKYSLNDYSELLLIFLIDVKSRNDLIVSRVSTEEGIKLWMTYVEDLKKLYSLHNELKNPDRFVTRVTVKFNDDESIGFNSPIAIYNVLLREVRFWSKEIKPHHGLYQKNKKEINNHFLRNVAEALYDFLRGETNYFQRILKNDDLRIINEFLELTGIPIYGNNIEPLEYEHDRIKILYNWISPITH